MSTITTPLTQNPPTKNTCEHLAKGAGWGTLSVISALAIAIIVGSVLALGIGLVTFDIMILVNWASASLINLLWAIPTTVVFIGLDIIIVRWISDKAQEELITPLGNAANKCFRKALDHFSQFTTPESCNNEA